MPPRPGERPRLQGTATTKHVSRTVSTEDDSIGRPRRSPADLDAAILALLVDGALMKWQIREALHEPETFIVSRLKRLRDAGQIKVVGKVLDKRRWALPDWIEPPPPVKTAPVHVKVTKTSKLREPHERPSSQTVKPEDPQAWWITAPREGFSKLAGQHTERMRSSRESLSVDPRTRD